MVELIIAGVVFGALKDNTVQMLESTADVLRFRSSPKIKSIIVCAVCGGFMVYPLIMLIVGIVVAGSGSGLDYIGEVWVVTGVVLIVYAVVEALIGAIVLTILLAFMTDTEVTMDRTTKTMKIVTRKVMCCSCFGEVEKVIPYDTITSIDQIDDNICCACEAQYCGFRVNTNQETYQPRRANITKTALLQIQQALQFSRGGGVVGPYPPQQYPQVVAYPQSAAYPPQQYPPVSSYQYPPPQQQYPPPGAAAYAAYPPQQQQGAYPPQQQYAQQQYPGQQPQPGGAAADNVKQ